MFFFPIETIGLLFIWFRRIIVLAKLAVLWTILMLANILSSLSRKPRIKTKVSLVAVPIGIGVKAKVKRKILVQISPLALSTISNKKIPKTILFLLSISNYNTISFSVND